MRRRSTHYQRRLLLLCIFIGALIWQLYPPFDDAQQYEGLRHEEVISLLGAPQEWMPEKHVAWQRQRLLSFWYLTASYQAPSDGGQAEFYGYTRLFCIGIKSYNFKIAL